jgi:hypothetical protein
MTAHEPFKTGNEIGKKPKKPRNAGDKLKRRLSQFDSYTKEQLEDIRDNAASSIGEVSAAVHRLSEIRDDYLGLHCRSFTTEHLSGRAVNSVIVQQVDSQSPEEKLGALLADVHRSLGMTAPQQVEQVKRIESETTDAAPD